MRRIALIVGIIGLGVLVSFLISNGEEVSSLDGLVVGEVVSISGIVDEERKFGAGKLLIVDDIPVFCECHNEYAGKEVFISGMVERFPEDLRIRAFKVQILD